jgi:O-antigen/teichoic acid export membrane protein
MWFYFQRYNLHPTKFSLEKIKLHFIGSMKLFVPMLAIEVYTVLDKTMVGILSTEAEVGYYTMSQRLVKMILALITSLGAVVMPRMSNLIATEQHEEVEKYIRVIFEFLTYASILAMVLILVTMKDFVPLFFGSKFLKVKDLVVYITPIILFISWSNLFGIQIMVPMKKENYLTASVIAGALVNFTMNLLLIPNYQALGAVIGTVVAEFTVTLVQMILVRKLISLKPLFSQIWKHIIAGLITLLVLLLLSQINLNPIWRIVLELATGLTVYVSVEMILKSSINTLVFRKILSFLRIYPS